MQITRTEKETGGPDRTPRKEIDTLLPAGKTGKRGAEPEMYLDFSESEGWPWSSNPDVCTWDVQIAAVRGFIVPFEQLDSEAASEQADGSDDHGGVYCYPFSTRFLPLGVGDDDGDLNSSNFNRKIGGLLSTYGSGGKPAGTTHIMSAVRAGDEHYLGEFGPGGENEKPRDERPVRVRVVWSDGKLDDEKQFREYLENAKLTEEGFGAHGEWDEIWAICITGEAGGGGAAAYRQYVELAKNHPWIHAYYFENVTNPDEVAEDMAIAALPQ